MNAVRNRRRRLSGAAALAVAGTLALAPLAAASNATAGATYVGSYSTGLSDAIAFKVSSNGKRVIELKVSTPFKCHGGCGGVGSASPGSTSIAKNGTFKVTLNLKFPATGSKAIGTVTVTGKFLKHGEATGTVKSHFNSSSAGETVRWSAVS